MGEEVSTFPRNKGSDGTHGINFEWKTTLLAYLKCVEQHEEWKRTNNSGLKSFFVANNVKGVGAFDDVVVRKEIVQNGETKTKLTFTQCKHVAVNESNLKKGGNYVTKKEIQKYFDSFNEVHKILITSEFNLDAQEKKTGDQENSITNRMKLKKFFNCEFSECKFSFVSNIASFPKDLFEDITETTESWETASNTDLANHRGENTYKLRYDKCLEFLEYNKADGIRDDRIIQFCKLFRIFSIPDLKTHSEIDEALRNLCEKNLLTNIPQKFLRDELLNETKLTFEESILLNEKSAMFKNMIEFLYLKETSNSKINTYNQIIPLNIKSATEIIAKIHDISETDYLKLVRIRILQSFFYLKQKYMCIIVCSEDYFRKWELARCTLKYKKESKIYIFFENCISTPEKEEMNERFVKLVHKSGNQHQSTLFEQLSAKEVNVVGNSMILFQGFEIALKELCNNWGEILDENAICKILESQQLVIGTTFPNEPNFYIKRKLKIKVLGKEIRNLIASSMQPVHRNGTEKFLLVSNKDQNTNMFDEESSYKFTNSCNFIDNIKQARIQFREIFKSKNVSFYFCNFSCDKIDLQYMFGKERQYIEEIIVDEVFLIKESENKKFILLSDVAGMGKSTSMLNLASEYKSSHKYHWVHYVSLGKFSLDLEKSETINVRSNAIYFLASKILQLKGIDLKLFTYECITTGNIAIFLDGFDELSPKARDDFPAFLFLLEDTKISKIFLSSRPNVMQDLEKFTLQNSVEFIELGSEEKENCLLNIWKTKLSETEQNISIEKLKKIAKYVIKDSESEKNSIKEILAIPLQIKMFASAYYEKMLEYYKSNVNFKFRFDILHLYKNFIRSQVIHYLTKSIPDWNRFSEHEKNKRVREKLKDVPEVVCSLLCPNFVKSNIKDMKEEIENLRDDLGLITDSGQMPPLFLHKTMAEYLAAEFIVKQFLSQRNEKETEQEFENILTEKGHEVLRMFINFLLEENNFPSYFENNCAENKVLNKLMSKNTPLHIAASEGNVTLLKALLQRDKSCITFKNSNGNTALFSACLENKIDAVKCLISHDCSVIERNKIRSTAFHYAAEKGNAEIMGILLLRDSSIVNMKNIEGQTPLHLSCCYGKKDAVKFLLSKDCSVIDRDNNGSTAFHLAAGRGHKEIMEIILHRDTSILNMQNIEGHTPLHCSCWYGETDAVNLLLSQGCSFNDFTNRGNTAFHIASKEGHTDVMKILFHCNASFLNMHNAEGSTPLHYACCNDKIAAVEFLLSQDCSIIERDNDDDTAFHVAALEGNREIMKILLHRNASLLNMQNSKGGTPLHFACWYDKIEAVEFLLSQDCSIIERDNNGSTAFHLAAKKGHIEIMELLFQRDASLINFRNNHGLTPLQETVTYDHIEACKYMLKQGCSVKNRDNDGDTVFSEAAIRNNVEAMELLLQHDKSLLNEANDKGETPLHQACLQGNEVAVKYLLRSECSVKEFDNQGDTALHKAALEGHIEIMLLLLERDKSLIEFKNFEGRTPFCLASSNGKTVAADLLTEYIVD